MLRNVTFALWCSEWVCACSYLFNLMVGTGCLALPSVLLKGGWVRSSPCPPSMVSECNSVVQRAMAILSSCELKYAMVDLLTGFGYLLRCNRCVSQVLSHSWFFLEHNSIHVLHAIVTIWNELLNMILALIDFIVIPSVHKFKQYLRLLHASMQLCKCDVCAGVNGHSKCLSPAQKGVSLRSLVFFFLLDSFPVDLAKMAESVDLIWVKAYWNIWIENTGFRKLQVPVEWFNVYFVQHRLPASNLVCIINSGRMGSMNPFWVKRLDIEEMTFLVRRNRTLCLNQVTKAYSRFQRR